MSTCTVRTVLDYFGETLDAGLAYRINRYAAIPAPLKIPTTPAPTSVPESPASVVAEDWSTSAIEPEVTAPSRTSTILEAAKAAGERALEMRRIARRAGVAIVPILWDVEEAIREAHWARENGLRGVLLPTRWGALDAYHERKYDPFWAVCQDLDLVGCERQLRERDRAVIVVLDLVGPSRGP